MGLTVEENMNKTNHSTGYIRSITNPLQRGDQHTTTKYCLFLVKLFCLFLSERIFYRVSIRKTFAQFLRKETQNFSFFAHQFCAKFKNVKDMSKEYQKDATNAKKGEK